MMNTRSLVLTLSLIAVAACSATADAQVTKKYRFVNGKWEEVRPETVEVAKTAPDIEPLVVDTTLNVSSNTFPTYFYAPVIFDSYDLKLQPDSISTTSHAKDSDPLKWATDRIQVNERFRAFKQRYMIDNPDRIEYNINTLPEAPKQYRAYVDPKKATITIEEIKIDPNHVKKDVKPVDLKKVNWLHTFDGLIQFSQAYNSPNWYQGGNNNLNMIVNGIYNVKLNQAFHPNLFFENTIQYKLAMNSAPDDSLRNYSISEDLFQINTKFGIKAAKRWYYSATLQFKTQLLTNYKTNTNDLTASFLSPGELNLGLGMTYTYATPSKKFSVDASFAPLSYNLKMCTNKRIDETIYGIKPGHTSVSQYGSNLDCKMSWNIAYNINFTSRLTAFTDYSYLQGDLENTLSFSINRFLSTQIYVHLRYDSTTVRTDDSKWHKWQLKEILSFGFAYKIATV